MTAFAHPRVLLIDDTPSIHEDFRKILTPRQRAEDLDQSDFALFEVSVPHSGGDYALDCAFQGRDGVAMAEAAMVEGRPYAVAFVDMRMPPGWDGAQTIEHLWHVDPQIQVVICTAYSDHPWEELLERLDVRDRLLIVKKPFDMIEVSQLARTLTAKWALAREAAANTALLLATVRELRATEAALHQSNKELEAFSYSVAHDLRSPLSAVDSFSQLLNEAMGAHSADRSTHYLQRIRGGIRQMREITDGLLAMAQITRKRLRSEPVALSSVALEVFEALQERDADRVVDIRVHQGMSVRGDPALLRQVLENLLSNAWKFTTRAAAPVIEVGQLRDHPDSPVYFVRDNGAGFDMAKADKLFGAFQRLHSADDFVGTGIGLATTHRIVSRHAGRIWAEAIVGQGATFFFTLQESPPPALDATGSAPPALSP